MGQIELVSWIWHLTASEVEALVLELWGIWSATFIAITPRSTLTQIGIPVRDLLMGQIELFIYYIWNHLTVRKQTIDVKFE